MKSDRWQVFLVLFGCLGFVACSGPDVDCQTEKDCIAGTHCNVEIGECVECFDNKHCKEDAFCCAGRCEPAESIIEMCGCNPKKQGNPGTDCGLNFSLGATDLGGPVCQFDGVLNIEVADISRATCGCVDQGGGDEPCGRDENQLIGFCVENRCEAQSKNRCGMDKHVCSTATGSGPECLAKSDGFGACGCKRSEDSLVAGGCDAKVDGHIIADICKDDERCGCQANPSGGVCAVDSHNPDCTADGCTNILTDANNCGESGNPCGLDSDGAQLRCLSGGCECKSNRVCQTDLTSRCVYLENDVRGCVCHTNVDEAGQMSPCEVGQKCTSGGCVAAE